MAIKAFENRLGRNEDKLLKFANAAIKTCFDPIVDPKFAKTNSAKK